MISMEDRLLLENFKSLDGQVHEIFHHWFNQCGSLGAEDKVDLILKVLATNIVFVIWNFADKEAQDISKVFDELTNKMKEIYSLRLHKE